MTYKVTDRTLTATSIDFSGATYALLLNLVRGDLGKDNFDGDSIVPKWVDVRFSWNSAQPDTDAFNTVRTVLVQSSILGTPTPGGSVFDDTWLGTAQAPLAQRLEERIKSYKVLFDKTYNVNNDGQQQISDHIFIPGNRLIPVEYTSTGTLSITKGSIFLFVMSDDGVTDFPDFQFVSRVKFSDH